MLTLECTFLRDVYEASVGADAREAEWPPSWFRLFCALVAVAEDGDDDLLERLERAPAPELVASDASRFTRTAYVPVNRIEKVIAHQELPGRWALDRSWARSCPSDRRVYFHWDELEVDAQRLDGLCRRIPYLGRSTSPVVVRVVEGDPPTGGRWHRWAPSAGAGEERVRVPGPDALRALRDLHERKERGEPADPWSVAVWCDYGTGRRGTVAPSPALRGPYRHLVVFRLEAPQIDGRHTARVTRAVRRALMARAGKPPAALHGHHGGDVVQVAVLGLPFVGSRHADGHLVGVALAIPELNPEERAVLVRALPLPGSALHVVAGPLGVLELRRLTLVEAESGPLTTRPGRWTGRSREWATVLPMVLDRHLKRGSDVVAEVRRSVVNAGYPSPEVLTIARRPLVEGGVDLAPRDTVRRATDRGFRPYRHVVLRFPEPLQGPVVVGSMRHYGLGLCLPTDGTR